MWHVLNLLLGIVDRRHNRGGELLEQVGKTVLFRCCFTCARAALSLGGDATIGIETAEGSIAFLQDATAFFNKRLDVVDKFFFIKFIAGGTISLFDILRSY